MKEIKNPFSFNTIGRPDIVLLKFIFIEILSLSNNFLKKFFKLIFDFFF